MLLFRIFSVSRCNGVPLLQNVSITITECCYFRISVSLIVMEYSYFRFSVSVATMECYYFSLFFCYCCLKVKVDHTAILQFRCFVIQSAGMSEFWYIGFLGCRSTGMMGYWPGMMGYWDVEVLG